VTKMSLHYRVPSVVPGQVIIGSVFVRLDVSSEKTLPLNCADFGSNPMLFSHDSVHIKLERDPVFGRDVSPR
jgi:hypothetical protein